MGFRGFAFQLAISEAQRVHIVAQAFILSACVAQADITAPDSADMRKGPGPAALQGRHQFNSPITDEAHVVLAFYLESEKQHLRKNDSCEEGQRTMARKSVDHNFRTS